MDAVARPIVTSDSSGPQASGNLPSSGVKSPELKISLRFNSEDADLTFRSSDGTLFKIHSVNLNCVTGNIPRGGGHGSVVDLTEPVNILELLFQFVYPNPQPNLSEIEVTTLIELGDAASHYKVYPAIPVCNMVLSQLLPHSAVEILQYALTFGHTLLMDLAAPHVTPSSVVEALPDSSSTFNKTWILYWSIRCRAFSAVFSSPRSCTHQCNNWYPFMNSTLIRVGELLAAGSTSLENIASIISIEDPYCCMLVARKWKNDVEQALATSVGGLFSQCIIKEDSEDDLPNKPGPV